MMIYPYQYYFSIDCAECQDLILQCENDIIGDSKGVWAKMSQDDNSRKIDTDLEAELKRLRQALDDAEKSRLSGKPTLSLDEARAMLNEKFKDLKI